MTARIIVVEDESLIALMLEDLLMEFGHCVVGVAGNLSQAKALAAAGGFEIALLDVNLAGEQTSDLARSLLSQGVGVVMATGYGVSGVEPDLVDRVITLQKPIDETALAAAIDRLTKKEAAP
ncbi:MAG: response regulator [Pseudomonadota bacterium]